MPEEWDAADVHPRMSVFPFSAGPAVCPGRDLVLLTVGSAVAYPFLMETIPRLGHNRNTGAYFGFFWTIAGIGTITSNTLTGVLFDIRDDIGVPALPWLALLAIGCICITGILLLDRSGRLAASTQPQEQPAVT